jgi:hypothetical protein
MTSALAMFSGGSSTRTWGSSRDGERSPAQRWVCRRARLRRGLSGAKDSVVCRPELSERGASLLPHPRSRLCRYTPIAPREAHPWRASAQAEEPQPRCRLERVAAGLGGGVLCKPSLGVWHVADAQRTRLRRASSPRAALRPRFGREGIEPQRARKILPWLLSVIQMLRGRGERGRIEAL